jgi:serum/glucocorticoid-regulated kinase 2
MLKKNGQGGENVVFSDFVLKINRKGKTQERAILITNKAVYNLKVKNYGSCQRRIPMANIEAVSTSTISDEFVLHVPSEYDYRYKSIQKEKIVIALKQVKPGITAAKVQKPSLEEICWTKTMAGLLSREEQMLRIRKLAAEEVESDDEDRTDVAKSGADPNAVGTVDAMLQSDSKVRLADFDLLKVLGRGAFGKVMQVKKKSDGKIYAMKILKKGAIVARNQVEHTKAERTILQQLQHPFLMTLRFAFQSKDKLYLVLDYFQGGELFFHLKSQRRFSEDVARLYVAEIALAFGHLHSLGVIYRDLKPENILLDDSGHVCLTDFGLAKEMEAGDKAHTFCGTPEYLAPEIVQALGHDKAVDWWSLGILLYELTVGIPPFYSQNVNEMYNKIQHGVLRFPPFLSEGCKQLIIGLLNRDPKKRMGSENDVEDLKAHAFFMGQPEWNWDKVYNKEFEAPFKPNVSGEDDTSNFDEEFLREPVVDSVVAGSQLDQQGADFGNFTFQPNSTLS